MDLFIRLERGPHGKWGISWSKVTEETLRLTKPLTQSPLISLSPNTVLSLQLAKLQTQSPFKPLTQSPSQTQSPLKLVPSVGQNSKPKTLPASIGQASNLKSKHKPIYKWKPKPHQPFMSQYQTHPHSMYSSQAPPSHLFSSASSKPSSDKIDVELTLSHMEPTCTEKLLSVLNNSDASVTESMCFDACVDESLCFDGDVALQRDIQRIIHQHSDVIKKWGNFE